MTDSLISLENEIWKPVKNFEGLYEISNHGRLRSVDRLVFHKGFNKNINRKGKILKNTTSKGQYYIYAISKNNKLTYGLVHRLVAEHFIGEKPKGKQINHIDSNSFNNHYLNLEYVYARENNAHRNIKNNGKIKGYNLLPSGRYQAVICINRKKYPLGMFDTAEEATNAWKEATRKLNQGKYTEWPDRNLET